MGTLFGSDYRRGIRRSRRVWPVCGNWEMCSNCADIGQYTRSSSPTLFLTITHSEASGNEGRLEVLYNGERGVSDLWFMHFCMKNENIDLQHEIYYSLLTLTVSRCLSLSRNINKLKISYNEVTLSLIHWYSTWCGHMKFTTGCVWWWMVHGEYSRSMCWVGLHQRDIFHRKLRCLQRKKSNITACCDG